MVRVERREIRSEPGRMNLEDPLRLVNALQPVLAEVGEDDLRQRIADEITSGARDEDLPAVSSA